MEENQINVKSMGCLTLEQVSTLVEGLKRIKGFSFYIDAQFLIKEKEKGSVQP
jgi:hypothetical protein